MQYPPFRVAWAQILLGPLAVMAAMAGPVFAAGITGTPSPDPLLDGTPSGPCAALAAGPNYVPGTDAMGYPVVPADVGAPPVAIPDQVIVPLPGGRVHQDRYGHDDRDQNQNQSRGRHQGREGNGDNNGNGPYAVIDGRRLQRLINPPGCGDPVPPGAP